MLLILGEAVEELEEGNIERISEMQDSHLSKVASASVIMQVCVTVERDEETDDDDEEEDEDIDGESADEATLVLEIVDDSTGDLLMVTVPVVSEISSMFTDKVQVASLLTVD